MTLRGGGPRFGLTTGELELDDREVSLILGALSAQKRYCLNLARKNKEDEALGRNIVNAVEIGMLAEKIERAAKWGEEVTNGRTE